MSLVALAHWFVTRVQLQLKKKASGLTLDLAVRLLKAALPKRQLTTEAALEIVEYHLHRNETAKRSHTKTWQLKHKGVKLKPLLQPVFD